MPSRRILCLWFPRLGAERILRSAHYDTEIPFAVVQNKGAAQVLWSLSQAASAAGLHQGQPLRDAQAMCHSLLTRIYKPPSEALFLTRVRRWAGKYSPWVSASAPNSLVLDVTGCAHLFGGEVGLATQIEQETRGLRLSVQIGLADTLGAAWALAHYAGHRTAAYRNGDAIDQEARATRTRARKRQKQSLASPPTQTTKNQTARHSIAPPGQTHRVLGDLPVAALRLEPSILDQLSRLGLRRIGDLAGQPRAALARRFGKGLVLRLDQAFGSVAEPVSPTAAIPLFAIRLTLPDPIGLESDLAAAIERVLPRLCAKLKAANQGARQLRLQAYRCDQTMQWLDVGLARASADPDRIQPLLALKVSEIDAGFGIDMLRIEVIQTEPLQVHQHTHSLDSPTTAGGVVAPTVNIEDLMGRIGARIGLDHITRRHPGDSHIPEKSAQILAAAWSEPADNWPKPSRPRPLLIWPPEPVTAPETPTPPTQFRWRGRMLRTLQATGPERLVPEWWLDDPNWRSGVRDYWCITTDTGDRLWLFYAHGAGLSAGWFAQGSFA
ncbi:MAG: DNA polymerase Y family protein [Paracoccaceae bacterium]|nr:DNA polymerase Y family protein [Paracoccaceae bacterium]